MSHSRREEKGSTSAQVTLFAIGFGGAGIASGSIAALWQSAIGNVASGSLFSCLQSVGMAGIPLIGKLGLGITSGAMWQFLPNINFDASAGTHDRHLMIANTCINTNNTNLWYQESNQCFW